MAHVWGTEFSAANSYRDCPQMLVLSLRAFRYAREDPDLQNAAPIVTVRWIEVMPNLSRKAQTLADTRKLPLCLWRLS